MFNRTLIAFSFAALVAAGCGGGDDTTSVTTDDLATSNAGPDLAGAHLQSGTYTTSNIVKVSDGCGLMLEGAGNFPSTTVANTGSMLSIGGLCSAAFTSCNPDGTLEGTGAYTTSTTATLTFSSAINDSGCMYNKMVTTKVTFTGMNALHVDYTDNETNQTGCTAPLPTSACTSEYTFDLSM